MSSDYQNTDALSIVFVTVLNSDEGSSIAHDLVEKRLAACVNILPGLTSVFGWEGKIEAASETLLIIKTRKDLLNALTNRIQELHSYEVPEIVSIDISGSHEKYITWINAFLTKTKDWDDEQ
jgi:periplasmic divalent cation tolerance protein